MTNQEIFDKAALHLLTQNARAEDANGTCEYRAADGKMCAVGALIPDGDYDETIEGETVTSKPKYFLKIGFTEENLPVLKDLQYIHDETEVKDWRAELDRLAKENNLSTSALDDTAQ